MADKLTDKFVTVKIENHVAWVTLNRPEVHNAFNVEMIAALTKTFHAFQAPGDLRAIVLSGAGESFCAGGDLQWMKAVAGYSPAENQADAERLFDLFATMAECPVPVIGKLHGNVFGGGLGLTAVCDIAAADQATRFCFSEVKLGLEPATITPFVLRKLTLSAARWWALTAKTFSADEACAAGLIQVVGDKERVEKFVADTLAQLRANGPEAVRATKRLLNQAATTPWPQMRGPASKAIAERRASAEAQEGMQAFLAKRAPSWKLEK